MFGLNNLIKEYFNNSPGGRDYQFWDKSHTLKEDYRHKTKFGFSGKELETDTAGLIAILNNALEKVTLGLAKALDKKNNVYYSYFINEAAEYDLIKEHFVKPTKFIQKKLPFFLEGQMHALRLSKKANETRKLHRSTKSSGLYDKKTKDA